MKKIATLLLTIITLTGFGQSIETITEKVSNKICDCIREDISSYAEIEPEFNRCYDKEFNQIFNIVDSAEHKLLVRQGALEQVQNGIIPTLNTSCAKILTLLQSELEKTVEQAGSNSADPCPTNFTGKDLKKLKKKNGEIIAFNGMVTQVYTAHKDKPYYEVRLEGGSTIWIASLITSGYEVKDNIIRILGFVSKNENDEFAEKYNKTGFQVLAFCVLDLKTKQLSILPGSEPQVKEWLNGKVPRAGK